MILTGRKKRILEAIIVNYIATAEPVGSRTLAKNYDFGVSPATIRNEMADLEDMGYLEQPHTSAGRVPSDKGYRAYVNELLINRHMMSHTDDPMYLNALGIGGIDKLLRETLKIVSDLTEYTSIALTPHVARSTIMQVELLRFNESALVVVLVTNAGTINDNIIKLTKTISAKEVDILNLSLNRILKGHNVEEIDEKMIEELQTCVDLPFDVRGIVNVIKNLLMSEADTEVLVEGKTNFFNFPEYHDVDRIKTILSFIEDTELILQSLGSVSDDDINISIGSENNVDEVKDCSIITISYNIKGKHAGTISIIGPKRMRYEKAIDIMDEVGPRLNRILTDYLFGK